MDYSFVVEDDRIYLVVYQIILGEKILRMKKDVTNKVTKLVAKIQNNDKRGVAK